MASKDKRRLARVVVELADRCMYNPKLSSVDGVVLADRLLSLSKVILAKKDEEEEDPKFSELRRQLRSAVPHLKYNLAKKPLKRIFDLGPTIPTVSKTGIDLIEMVIAMANMR